MVNDGDLGFGDDGMMIGDGWMIRDDLDDQGWLRMIQNGLVAGYGSKNKW